MEMWIKREHNKLSIKKSLALRLLHSIYSLPLVSFAILSILGFIYWIIGAIKKDEKMLWIYLYG